MVSKQKKHHVSLSNSFFKCILCKLLLILILKMKFYNIIQNVKIDIELILYFFTLDFALMI